MIKQIKNKLSRKNKKGFTLIELIVVIAIVAVLAAVGIPAIAGQVAKSQQSSANSNAKLLAEQAQIMLTQAEAAGEVTSGSSNVTVDLSFFGSTGILTASTGAANDGVFTTLVCEAANVIPDGTNAPEIMLEGISEGSGTSAVFVGVRVAAVKFTATNGNTEGYYPDKDTFDAL